jgi:protein SCO1
VLKLVCLAAACALILAAQPNRPVPDVELVDQNGRKVHFYRDLVAGRIVAINFIFTTCSTICPLLGANFAKVERLLGDRAGADIRLISVSVDPQHDTPRALHEFAARHGGKSGWTLVTGEKRNIEELLRALDEFTPDKLAHSANVLIGRGDGSWIRANGSGPPEEIVQLLVRGK